MWSDKVKNKINRKRIVYKIVYLFLIIIFCFIATESVIVKNDIFNVNDHKQNDKIVNNITHICKEEIFCKSILTEEFARLNAEFEDSFIIKESEHLLSCDLLDASLCDLLIPTEEFAKLNEKHSIMNE